MTDSAGTDLQPALDGLAEIPAATPANRPPTNRAWPVHHVLHLIGRGRLVLDVDQAADVEDQDDPRCAVRELHRDGDPVTYHGLAVQDRALRALFAAGLARLTDPPPTPSVDATSRHRPFELTEAGHTLWRRWAFLVHLEPARDVDATGPHDRTEPAVCERHHPQGHTRDRRNAEATSANPPAHQHIRRTTR